MFFVSFFKKAGAAAPALISYLAFQPLKHLHPAFLCHGEGLLPLHGAFLIAEKAVPVFTGNGALRKVHFLGRGHHHVGLCPEPEQAHRAGENVLHGKRMEGGQKDIGL